nr:hypothetical protein [Halalkalibacterium ligniniphilum]
MESDEQREINGIQVAIEKGIVSHVKDITLDFEKGERGAGLIILGGSNC